MIENEKFMTAKEILLEQFTVSYDQNGWFVALKNAVRNLTAEQAVWKTDGLDNSIWEILAHLNYYNFAYLERFKGENYVYPKSSNDETFESADDVSEAAWTSEVGRFKRIMDEWRERLAATEAKFGEKVPPEMEAVWWEVLANVMMHNARHGGQIVIIRKLQGSWDSAKGVS